MVAKHESIYLLFEDVEVKWQWSESEMLHFCQLWNDGKSIGEIAKAFNTNRRSIALAVMYMADEGYIAPRKNGLFGH